MSLLGARGVVRVAQNPGCVLLGAMVLEGIRNEPRFYERVTGEPYPGEYGERHSMRRRGIKFEQMLHANGAAELRRALARFLGERPDRVHVRNLEEEVPGSGDVLRAQRLSRTRRILRDLAAGRPVPHIVIKPQLVLPVGSRMVPVSPDFMALDPELRIYVPGEEKSFIVRDGQADAKDLERTRLQAAVSVEALRHEAARVGLADRVRDRALLIMATPYGLRAAPPVLEDVEGEVAAVRHAIQALESHERVLQELRERVDARLEDLADELPICYQERCLHACTMAPYCRVRVADSPHLLGDRIARMAPPGATLGRMLRLLRGDVPRSPEEAELAQMLEEVRPVVDLLLEVDSA